MTIEEALPQEDQDQRPTRNLLFVCNRNAGRSQIAQAFFEDLGPADVIAESAGSEPAREIPDAVIEVMGEVGIDLRDRKPKKLTLEMQLHADWAVTMGCGDMCPYVPSAVEAWDTPDPEGEPIERVREIRDEIRRQVQVLITLRLDAIREDRTAHELRLARLLPGLIAEFADTRPPELIRGCADAALETFANARIRSHVITLAHRKTRDCLRKDGCELLEETAA